MKRILIILFFAVSTTSLALSDDWPGWRGPNRDGISHETAWSPDRLNASAVLWKAEVGFGHASVAVVGDHVFTLGNQLLDGVHQDVVFCMDAHTGAVIWTHSYPSNEVSYPGPRATPLVRNGQVFTLSWQGIVHCLDAETGSVCWSRDLRLEGAEAPGFGFSGSPLIVDGLLVLNAGSLGMALDAETGAVAWKSPPGAGTLSTPLIFSAHGKWMAGIPQGRALYAIEVLTGEKRWWYPWYRDLDIDPILHDGKLFLPGYKGTKLISVDGENHETLMENWEVQFSAYQNFVVLEEHVYGFGKEGNRTPLQCVDMRTGVVRWQKDLGAFGSLSAADDKLIIVTGSGRLVIATTSNRAYEELAAAQVVDRPKDASSAPGLEWACWTQPVLSNGRIFIRSNYGQLVCVDVRG